MKPGKGNEKRARILLVEDDPNLSMVIIDYLEMLEYDTRLCKDGDEGLREFSGGSYDLVILDVMMPRKDGFSLAADIRKFDNSTPIIFLTAKAMKEDRIRGFHLGCDDYITKPFSTEELSLRISAILRRSKPEHENDLDDGIKGSVQIGKYTFDHANMTLRMDDVEISLTRKESALLKILYLYRNRLLTRETALKAVWGSDDYFIGRSMDVFISRLRKYLKQDPGISIVNVHGIGFRLETPS